MTTQEFFDSKVPWLGYVPKKWDISPLKRNTYIKARVGWKGLTSEEFEEDSYAYLVTGSDFRGKHIDWTSCYQVSEERFQDDPFIQLQNGDILVTKDGTIGKVSVVQNLDKPACLNSGVFLLRPTSDYLPEYMYWVLVSDVFKEFISYTSYGSTIQHLYQNVLVNFKFAFPSLDEQKTICDFLDRELAQIDVLAQKIDALAALADDSYRQTALSIILGLDVDQERQGLPAGSWAPSIPKTWKFASLRHFAHIYSGGTPDRAKPEYWSDGTIPWINSGAVNQEKVVEPSELITEAAIKGSSTRLAPGGSVVMALAGQGATKGTPAVMKIDAYCNQSMVAIVTDSRLDANYLYFWLSANYSNIRSMGGGDLRDGLNQEHVKSLKLPLPPVEDQIQIANTLWDEKEKLMVLLDRLESAKSVLMERRQSLISAAVTGKIDVRKVA
jgi:type I restriction enzyme S subunit